MNYETFEPEAGHADHTQRMNSDSSNTSSVTREVNVFHAVVRTRDSPFGKVNY
jgi:hypothetical protein